MTHSLRRYLEPLWRHCGAWFPLAALALWVLEPAAVSPTQLALVTLVPLTFAPAILVTWHRLQLDR